MPQRDREAYNAYHREYQLKRYHKRMNEAREKLGDKCCKCGSNKDLVIDHIDPKSKRFGIAKWWSSSQEKFDRELSKCQLLCGDCDRIKTREDLSRLKTEYWNPNKGV